MESSDRISKERSWLDKCPFFLLLLTSFLLPLFFIPTLSIFISTSKIMFVSTIVVVSLFLWLVSSWRNKEIVIPNSLLLLGGAVVSVCYFVSAFFSRSVRDSLIGNGVEIGTFASISVAFLLMFLFALYFQSKKKVLYFYSTFILSFFVLATLQVLRLVLGADFLSFGIFTNIVYSVLGSWNELAIFFGLMVVLSLNTIELPKKDDTLKIAMPFVLFISLFFLAIINFYSVWVVLMILSFTLLIHKISIAGFLEKGGELQTKKFPLFSSIVFGVSLVFIMLGGFIYPLISSSLGISYVDVNPSIQATFEIAKNVLTNNSLYWGVGPNQFIHQWLLYKPAVVNNTAFWNYSFNSGSGFIPSSLINVGVLGFLSWVFFLGVLFFYGFRVMLSLKEHGTSYNYLLNSFSFATFYLWLFLIIYNPGPSIFFLTFIFTGLFVALLVEDGVVKNKRMFFSSFIFAVLLAMVTVFVFFLTVNFISHVYYKKSLYNFNFSNLEEAGKDISKALNFEKTDLYYRVYSTIKASEMKVLLSREDLSEDEMKNQLGVVFNECVDNAVKAITINKFNYQNWMALGWIYEMAVPLGVGGAYDNAKKSYESALSLNPNDPSVILSMARLEVANKNLENAKAYIIDALNKKRDYKEAYVFLAQIQIGEGNIKNALTTMDFATSVLPNDYEVFYQSGLLKYDTEDYEGAVLVLERSVGLNPYYANAKYFLGLSYQKINQIDKAIAQFEDLEKMNPGNEDVGRILRSLRSE